MKKRSFAMLIAVIVIVGITGGSIATAMDLPTPNQTTLANYKASTVTGATDGNGGVYNSSNVMYPNYGWGEQGSGKSYHWGTMGLFNGGNVYGFTTNADTSAKNSIITQTFANDKLSGSADGLILDDINGIYVYESEFLVNYNGSTSYDYQFIGNAGKEIATLRLNTTSPLMKGGANIQGAATGKFNWTGNGPIGSFAATETAKMAVGYLKIEFDFRTHNLSAWLVQRKTGTGTYAATQPTDASHLLIKNYAFGNDITALAATKIFASGGTVTGTRGMGFTFIKISKIPAQDIVAAAVASYTHDAWTNVSGDIELPALFDGTDITWTSSDTNYIDNDGTFKWPLNGDKTELTKTFTLTPTFSRDGNSAQGSPVSVTLLNPNKTNSSINPDEASFDKFAESSNYLPVTIAFNAGDYSFASIEKDGTALTENVDYTVSGSNYTFSASYLSTLSKGKNVITFVTNGGISPTLTISVADTSPRAVDYSVGILRGTGYFGYSHINNMSYADMAAFYAVDGNAITNNNSAVPSIFFSGNGINVRRTSIGGSGDSKVIFGLPVVDENGVALPAESASADQKVLYTIMDFEVDNAAANMLLRVPADDTGNIRIGKNSDLIDIEHNVNGKNTYGIENYYDGSPVELKANTRYEIKTLQNLVFDSNVNGGSNRTNTKQWVWVKDKPKTDGFVLSLDNRSPRYGRGNSAQNIIDQKRVAFVLPNGQNTYSANIHKLEVYEADEYDLRQAIIETEKAVFSGVKLNSIFSDLPALPTSYAINSDAAGSAAKAAAITWTSSDTDYLGNDGAVTSPIGEGDQTVVLTAAYTIAGKTKTIDYTLTLRDYDADFYVLENFGAKANGVAIDSLTSLGGVDTSAAITLTGEISIVDEEPEYPLNIILVGYDSAGVLQNIKVGTVSATDVNYSLDCGQFLKDKEITKLKFFAWGGMEKIIPIPIN